MGLKTETHVFGMTVNQDGIPEFPGFQIQVKQLPMATGLDILAAFAKAFPSKIPMENQTSPVPVSKNGNELMNLLYGFIRNVLRDRTLLETARKTFGSFSMITVIENGKTIQEPLTVENQDVYFGANYSALFEWLYFCIIFNFGSLDNLIPVAGKGALSVMVGTAEKG